MKNLEGLKALIFELDNNACFIERERILQALSFEMCDEAVPDRYAQIFSRLLAGVSTPIYDQDVFVGRVVEGRPDPNMQAPNRLLCATGHMSFHYEKLLRIGLKGILQEINENAALLHDEKATEFAQNAEIVVMAIRDFAKRYADAARKCGKLQAADALEIVPYEGAYDIYSALQAVWLIHMIASCYVGERDYAFGRFDQYMYPYYQKALAEGVSQKAIVELLACFFLKTNEICGRTTHNYCSKPVLCQASKQYIMLGGECPNAFSFAALEAAELCNMAQPQFTVLLKPDADIAFTKQVFQSMVKLTDKLHVYNYDLIKNCLKNKGVPADMAADFSFSACCTFDLHYHTVRQEYYAPSVQLFCDTLKKGPYESICEIVQAYASQIKHHMQIYAQDAQKAYTMEENRRLFVLDSLLIGACAERCRYPMDGGMRYHVLNIFFPGIATLGDSLAALDRLVFQEKRYSYTAFMDIVNQNFEGQEELRLELQGMSKFGNDSEADVYATMIANGCLDAIDQISLPENWYAIGGFYSLERENTWAQTIPATPDGRLAGTPFSENQSPVYGADKNGITALLKSLSKLPLDRTATGGLNLTFSHEISSSILQSLLVTYFNLGGLHAGITVLNRETLQDAMVHPERYKSLTVRLYGFSEYFISLPEWQQLAVLNRTEY